MKKREQSASELLSFFCDAGEDTRQTKRMSGFNFQAILHEAAIRITAGSIGVSEARRIALCDLDGMDQVCFFHSAGR